MALRRLSVSRRLLGLGGLSCRLHRGLLRRWLLLRISCLTLGARRSLGARLWRWLSRGHLLVAVGRLTLAIGRLALRLRVGGTRLTIGPLLLALLAVVRGRALLSVGTQLHGERRHRLRPCPSTAPPSTQIG